MGRPRKVKPDTVTVTQEMLDQDPSLLENGIAVGDMIEFDTVEAPEVAEVVTEEELKTFVFHPSEKEVECNGQHCLEWTDEAGCTFKQARP